MKKKCFKCSKTKDVSDFYKHREMADRHLGKCKECTKKDSTEHRNKNIERIREYDKQRSKLPHRKILASKIQKKYRKQHPLRGRANLKLSRAAKAGKINKLSKCELCGTKERRICGHHSDYSEPLNVVWVCYICHK